MPADYAWIVTADFLSGDDAGTTGPHDAPDQFGDDWSFRAFRLYDGDDTLCYMGILAAADLDAEPAAFGPLDDFGRPNAGCTRIDHFREPGGVWETI